jgi:hypothetical protein
MTEAFMPAVRPDFYGQLAATDPYQSRSRRLFERGQVVAVSGNEADVRVGYDAQGNALEVKQVPIMSGYVPAVGDWVSIQYEAGHSSAPWITGPSMAAGDSSDSAGIGVFPVRESEPDDPPRSAIYFDSALASWRGWDGAEWVEFAGRLHNSLPDLQGGTAGQYYHLTQDEHAAIGGGAFPATAVIYADENGKLAGDASRLSWTATGLGIGCAALYPLHINRTDPVLLIQDTHTGLASANARLRLGESGSGGMLDNYWDVAAQPGSTNFSFQILRYSAGVGTTMVFEIYPNTWQALLNAGSAAAPILSRIGQSDDGVFFPGDGLFAVSLGGTERFRWSGDDLGMVAGGQLFLDGVACAGNTSIRERTSDIIAVKAGGYDQFEVRSTHQYGRPTTYDPANDGEFNLETDDNAWKHRIGSVVHRNGWCIYSGSPVEDTTGSGSERTLDSFTIPAAYWKVGKRVTVVATVLAEIVGNGKNVALRLKIGSTVAMEKTISGASSPTWRSGHFDFEMTFVVGAVAGSGTTIYPARTIRGFTSQSHADFNVIKTVATHELYPMEPDTPGLAIATDAAQTVSVTQQTNAAGVSVHLRLQGLTIYST